MKKNILTFTFYKLTIYLFPMVRKLHRIVQINPITHIKPSLVPSIEGIFFAPIKININPK